MVEQGAYATQLFAAIFFVVVGGRMLRLALRTKAAPERLLGLYFVLTGISYFGWVLPSLVALGPLLAPSDFATWGVYCVGVVPYLLFTRLVFRRDARWAVGLVAACIAALAIGTPALAWNGDLYPGFGDPFYWVQWLGYTVPCVWMTLEALGAHRSALRRCRIGLSDSIVANRYLLFAIFGGLQTLACAADLLVTIDSAEEHVVSAWSDAILGGLELGGIAMLWLAFFPPAAYLAWVDDSAQHAHERP
jgi:hypothetical protein